MSKKTISSEMVATNLGIKRRALHLRIKSFLNFKKKVEEYAKERNLSQKVYHAIIEYEAYKLFDNYRFESEVKNKKTLYNWYEN